MPKITGPTYTFRYLGKIENQYVVRAPTWNTSRRDQIDALHFRNDVFDWTVMQATSKTYIAYCNDKNYPSVPAFKSGNGLCVLFESKHDLIKFANEFRVKNIDELK